MSVDLNLIWEHPWRGLFGKPFLDALYSGFRAYPFSQTEAELLAWMMVLDGSMPEDEDGATEITIRSEVAKALKAGHFEFQDAAPRTYEEALAFHVEEDGDRTENPSGLLINYYDLGAKPVLRMPGLTAFLHVGTYYPNGIAYEHTVFPYTLMALWPYKGQVGFQDRRPVEPVLAQAYDLDTDQRAQVWWNQPKYQEVWLPYLARLQQFGQLLGRIAGAEALLVTHDYAAEYYPPEEYDGFDDLIADAWCQFGPPARSALEAYYGQFHRPAEGQPYGRPGFLRRHYLVEPVPARP